MVQKIHPQGVIWVPSSRLMWADQLKKIDSSSVPSIFNEVHVLGNIWLTFTKESIIGDKLLRF